MEKTDDIYLKAFLDGYATRRIEELNERQNLLESVQQRNDERLTVIEKRLSDMLYHNGKHLAETPSKVTGLQCLFETLPVEEVPDGSPLYSHRCRNKECRHVIKNRDSTKKMKCPKCKVAWMTVRALKYLTPKNLARYPAMMKEIYGTEVSA